MVAIREAYREHERKRFMRRDAHRYWRPDAERWMTAEERRLFRPSQRPVMSLPESKDGLERRDESSAVIEAEREELLRLKRVLAGLKFDLALLRFARKYRPDQPRVPAGNPDGGQWTTGDQANTGATGEPIPPSHLGPERVPKLTLAAMSRNATCEAQWLADILICKTFRNRACYNQAMVRLIACEKGQTIPPLTF